MMKKLACAAMALTLVASLSLSALAAPGLLISGNPNAKYAGQITVNGTALNLKETPATTMENALPMRAVVEADYGYANWFQDENKAFFSLDGVNIYVNCINGEVELDGTVVKDMKAEVKDGTTFVPAAIFKAIAGYAVTTKDGTIALTTPNSDPMVLLARQIIATNKMGSSMKQSLAQMEEFYGITAANFTQAVGFFPMMISADTVVIGKVASGKMDAVKKELEAQRAKTQQGFEQYLPGPLEVAKNGKIITSGDYVMLILSGDNDTATKMFKDGVKNIK